MGNKETIIGRIQRIVDQRGDKDAVHAMGSAGESWEPSSEEGKEKGLPLFVEGMVEEGSPFSASGDNPVTVVTKDYTIVPMRGIWNGLKVQYAGGLRYSYSAGQVYIGRKSYDVTAGSGFLPPNDTYYVYLKDNGGNYQVTYIKLSTPDPEVEKGYVHLTQREKDAMILLAQVEVGAGSIYPDRIYDVRPLFRPNNGIDSGLSVYPNGGLYFNLSSGRVYLDSKVFDIAESELPIGPLEDDSEYNIYIWLNDEGQAELKYETADPTGMYAMLAKLTTASNRVTAVEDLRFYVHRNRVIDTNQERDGLEVSVYGTTQYRFTNGKVLLGGEEKEVINDNGILEGIQVQENDPIGLRYKYSAGSAHIDGNIKVVPDKVKEVVLIEEGTFEAEVEARGGLEYRVNKGYAYVNGEMNRVRVKDHVAEDNSTIYVYVNADGEVVHGSSAPSGDYTDLAVVKAVNGQLAIQDKRNLIPNKTYYVYIDENSNVSHSETPPTGIFANLATLEVIDGDIATVTDTRIILASEELPSNKEIFVYVDASGNVVHAEALPESGDYVRLAKLTTEEAIVNTEDLRPYDGTLNGCEVTSNSPEEGIYYNYTAGQAYVDGDFIDAEMKIGAGPIEDAKTFLIYINSGGLVQHTTGTPIGDYAEMSIVKTADGKIESVEDIATPVGGFNGIEFGFTLTNIDGFKVDINSGTVYVNNNRIYIPPADQEVSEVIGTYTLPINQPLVYIYLKEDSTTPPVNGNIVVDTALPNDRQAVVIAIASTDYAGITSLHDTRPLLLDEWNQIRDNGDGSTFDPFLMNCEQLWQDIREVQNDRRYDVDGNWKTDDPENVDELFDPDLMNSRRLWDDIRAIENDSRTDIDGNRYTVDPENVDDLFDPTEMNARQLWDDIRHVEDDHGDETVGIDYDSSVMNVRHLHNDIRLLEDNDDNEVAGNPYNPTEMNARLFHFLIHSLENNFDAETAGIPYDPAEMNVQRLHFDVHSLEDNFGIETSGIAYDAAAMNVRLIHFLLHSLEDDFGNETVGIAYDSSVMNARHLHHDIRELESQSGTAGTFDSSIHNTVALYDNIQEARGLIHETRAGSVVSSGSFVPDTMNNVQLYNKLLEVAALGVLPHDYYWQDGVWEGCEPSYIQGIKGGRQAQYAVSAGTVKIGMVDFAVSAKSATNLTSGSVNWVYIDDAGVVQSTTTKGDIDPEDIPIAIYNVDADNQITYAVDVRGSFRTLNGVVDGIEVTDNGGLQIAYADGNVLLGGFDFSVSGSTALVYDDSSTYVYVDESGTLQTSLESPADFDGVRRGADVYQSGDMQITYSAMDVISNGNVYDSIASGTVDFYDNYHPVDNYLFVNEDGGIEYFRNDPSQNYVASGGYVSDGGGLQVDYSSANVYVNGTNFPSIPSGSVTLPANKDSYIYVDENQRVGYSHRNPGDNVVVTGLVVSDSGGLSISCTGGEARVGGSIFASVSSINPVLDPNSTYYVYVNDAGVAVYSTNHPNADLYGDYVLLAIVTTSTSSIDSIDDSMKNNWNVTIMAKVTTGASSITSIEDKRVYTQFSVVSTNNGAITDIQDVRNGGQIARYRDYAVIALVTTESGSITGIEDLREYTTFHFNQTLYNHRSSGVEVGLDYDSDSGLDFTVKEGVAYVFGNRFEYPDTTVTLTANTRNHIYIDNAGNVVAYEYSAIMDKPEGEYALLFVVVTGASTISEYIDVRPIIRTTIDALKDNEDGSGFDPYTMNAKTMREDIDDLDSTKAEDGQNYTVTATDQTNGYATITHDLGRYPIVQVVLNSTSKVDFTADIEHTSVNEFKVNSPSQDDVIVYI